MPNSASNDSPPPTTSALQIVDWAMPLFSARTDQTHIPGGNCQLNTGMTLHHHLKKKDYGPTATIRWELLRGTPYALRLSAALPRGTSRWQATRHPQPNTSPSWRVGHAGSSSELYLPRRRATKLVSLSGRKPAASIPWCSSCGSVTRPQRAVTLCVIPLPTNKLWQAITATAVLINSLGFFQHSFHGSHPGQDWTGGFPGMQAKFVVIGLTGGSLRGKSMWHSFLPFIHLDDSWTPTCS